MWAVARKQKRSVEIDEACAGSKQKRGRHGKRGRDHATDHEAEPERLGLLRQGQSLGQSSGLVELDVDYLVARTQGFEPGTVMHALIGTNGYDMGDFCK